MKLTDRARQLEFAKGILRGDCSTVGDELPLAQAVVSYALENDRLWELIQSVLDDVRLDPADGAPILSRVTLDAAEAVVNRRLKAAS